jgi:hypothetical protein
VLKAESHRCSKRCDGELRADEVAERLWQQRDQIAQAGSPFDEGDQLHQQPLEEREADYERQGQARVVVQVTPDQRGHDASIAIHSHRSLGSSRK